MKTAQERADEYAMNEATRQETNALDAQDRACQAFYDSLDW